MSHGLEEGATAAPLPLRVAVGSGRSNPGSLQTHRHRWEKHEEARPRAGTYQALCSIHIRALGSRESPSLGSGTVTPPHLGSGYVLQRDAHKPARQLGSPPGQQRTTREPEPVGGTSVHTGSGASMGLRVPTTPHSHQDANSLTWTLAYL